MLIQCCLNIESQGEAIKRRDNFSSQHTKAINKHIQKTIKFYRVFQQIRKFSNASSYQILTVNFILFLSSFRIQQHRCAPLHRHSTTRSLLSPKRREPIQYMPPESAHEQKCARRHTVSKSTYKMSSPVVCTLPRKQQDVTSCYSYLPQPDLGCAIKSRLWQWGMRSCLHDANI